MMENDYNNRLADESDQASALEEREREYSLQKMANDRKAMEEKARNSQVRDESGNVLCEDCGNAIPPQRLEALPYAVQCIACKQAQEKIDKRFS